MALALWLGLILLRLQVDDPIAAVLVLQIVPIGIVAAHWGFAAGACLAALSMGAVAIWATANSVELGVLGYAVRGAAFAAAAAAPALGRVELGTPRTVESPPDLALTLPLSLEAPALARTALERFDGALSPPRLYEAKVLTTELVTNAIRHGSLGPVEVRARLGKEALRVEVRDEGGDLRPAPRELASEGAGGVGLHVVDSLSTRWGVRHGGSQAWFELARAD